MTVRARGRRCGEDCGGFEHQGVHEGLGKIAAQLSLSDVVLLGEQTGWTAGRTVSLEPADCRGGGALPMGGERHE